MIASIPNLRDLGGHATRDGRIVRAGLIYRAEQLSHIATEDAQVFAGLGLKKIYDLRTAFERVAQPDEVPIGAQDVVEDIMADAAGAAPAQLLQLLTDPGKANAMLGSGKIVAMFTVGYGDFVSLPSARAGYKQMFTELADPANLPALFHCTTGKDRTPGAQISMDLLSHGTSGGGRRCCLVKEPL